MNAIIAVVSALGGFMACLALVGGIERDRTLLVVPGVTAGLAVWVVWELLAW